MMAIAARYVRNIILQRLSGSAVFIAFLIAVLAPINTSWAGELVINQPTIRAPVPGSPVAAGYIEIVNGTDTADRLIAAKTDFAAMTQIHEMKVVDNIMRMRPLPNGLEIPAGATVRLKSGGFHLMFMRLNDHPKSGETRKVTLTFEKAGVMELDFSVKTKAEIDQ